MNLTPQLRQEYDDLFASCEIRTKPVDYHDAVEDFIRRLMKGVGKYNEIQTNTGVPWFVVGLIHGMECGFDFGAHLHNGDSLQHRTHNEPAGRPPHGEPPFDWAFSAYDALKYDGFTDWNDWSIPGICFKLEGYNGWGYRKHGINSPYLWSFSNHYSSGKYVSDGEWSSSAVSKQCGAITALWKMVFNKLVSLHAVPVNG